MSGKRRHLEIDQVDDAGLFADDFDIDEFLGEQAWPRASRRERRRRASRRRLEELRERRWLRDEAEDWDDYL